MRNKLKRFLAIVLTTAMVLNVGPMSVIVNAMADGIRAMAAEDVLDAAIFCSDVHKSASDLTSVLGGVKTSGVDYSSIGFVGDTCLTVANTTSTVQNALGDTDISVMFSYAASHDTENNADISTNWNYSGEVEGVSDYYLVYTIRETDMQNASGANTAAPAFTTWYNGLTAAEKALPIFIMSHRPLHDRREDNAGAATWYDAISAAADSSDIVFFWGHNHTGETSVDTAAYYVAKDGAETFTVYNGDTVTPNFTYMNAGYINANNQDPKRIGVATTVQITEDSLIFQDYSSSGTYTDSNYSHNVTVAREFAVDEPVVTLSTITVTPPTKVEYTVGETLDTTGMVVTAAYSDGSTAEIAVENYTVSEVDMTTAGTKTVTVTHEGKTATFELTVKEPETEPVVTLSSIEVTTLPTKVEYTVGEALDTTGMVVTATYSDGSTAEIAVENYTVSEVDMTTAGTKTVTVTHDGKTATFEITVNEAETEPVVTLSSIEVTTLPTKVEYTVGEALDTNGMVVTATYSDGTTEEISADAYRISEVDMTTAGTKTVTVTYEDKTAIFEITVNEAVTEPTENTVTYADNLITIQATALGLTAIEAENVWGEPDLSGTFSDYVAYDVTLTGHTDGNEVFYSMLLVDEMDTTNLELYYVAEDGTLTAIPFELVADEQGNQYVEFTTTYVGTFAYGALVVPDEYTLTGLEVANIETTEYFVGESLDMVNAVVTATYTNAAGATYTSIIFDAYDLTFDMNVVGKQTVTVSYTDGEVTVSDTFEIEIFQKVFPDEDTGVSVEVNVHGATAITAATSTNENVADAVADVMEEGSYVAYDIELAGYNDGETVTVTLPIPDGVENPVVYYVSDDGATVTDMNAAVNEGGATVSFETDHFSTYVVGEDAVTVYESDATVPESTTTKTTYNEEEVTVYKLVTTPESGKQYLIVNSNTGTGYGLDGDTTGYATTQFTDGDGYYSSWSTETNSGTAFVAGNDVYLTTSGAYLWTAGSNSFDIGYTQNSSGDFLNGFTYTYTLNPAESADTWTLSNNQLYINLETSGWDIFGGSSASANFYLSGDSAWSMSTTEANVYFYEPVTVYKVTTSTETVTIPKSVYHMDLIVDGNAVTDHAYTVTGVVNGTTAAMWANFTATTTTGGTATAIDWPDGGSFTILSSSNEEVATMGSDGVLTFTGVAGETVVQVEYTWTVDGVEYKTQNYVVITAVPPVYDMTIIDPESTQIKIGATTGLTATATADGIAIEGATITWSSSDGNIATVDASTGVVTGVAAGNVTITATWTDPNGTAHTDTQILEVVDAVYALDLCEPTYTLAESYAEGTTYFVKQEDGTYIADTTVTADTFDATKHYTQSNSPIIAPIVIKDVVAGDTYTNIWAVIYADGEDLGKLNDEQLTKLTYISNNTNIATVDKTTGAVTFQGGTGTVTITCMYEYADGKFVTDTVVFSVSGDHYYVPGDGTDDFPEYPNEGAIRFDKTATAVGSFSKTGIVNVELSMTGVPYTTGSEIDVVVMLDMTGSMSDNGMEAAEEATKAFVKTIVVNEDGTYNNNRVAVYAFNSGSSSPYELVSLKSITSDSELETANTAIDTASNKQASGGTPFDEAAQKCHDVLAAAKTDGIGDDRQQFCVFMSDGGPTAYEGSDGKSYYAGNNGSGDVALTSVMTGYSSSTASDWVFSVPSEYWTDDMKADGVTVYTVGLLLQSAPNNPAPYSSMTDSTYDSTTDSLTTIGSHYFFTSSILKQMASSEDKYIDIFNVDNASKATAAFENIAKSILDAAKDVKVVDKITDDFTMVFEAPNATVSGALPEGQEFYIEVKDYTLNPVYGADGTTIVDYTRGSYTSLMKVYLGTNTDGSYYAASDAVGTAHATPTFNTTAIGTKFYWTTVAENGDSGVSVVDADKTTYYFVSTGDGTHNMASGAYASGTKTTTKSTTSDGTEVSSTTSTDLIIATPYFVYNASTRMLVWTAEKLNSSELALSYFLYLDKSGGWSGAEGEAEAGSYDTNDYANLYYTNFNDRECEQVFPVPSITWNGAQVSYVFYLVNDEGQPVNRAGRVVPFSEAVYVTDTYTHSIVWNDLEQTASLEAEYLAADLVPEVYKLYDGDATYSIHVFEDEDAQNLNNHFVIGGSTNTTYVFNTKADATKYTAPATYAATETYLCKDYNVTVNADNSITYDGDKTQYTENGVAMVGADDKGAYAIVYNTGASTVYTGFDFSNTTVAFAVTWVPALVEDTVVVDYGLDVVIDVTTNDALASGVVGVRADAPSGVTINNGTYDAAKAVTVDLYIDSNNDSEGLKELKIGTASVESLTSVRFSLDKTNGMQFTDPAVFYYESDVNYYQDSVLTNTSMYSKVTVIPATTVYYEDDFLTLTTRDSSGNEIDNEWVAEGTVIGTTQDQDRPGASQISAALDADNKYGYDNAYTEMSMYSLGSAAKITVNSSMRGEATFTFYGTGFDVIGMTSNMTGTLIVQVYSGASATGTAVKSSIVDTYYGMEEDGTLSVNNPSALYQVPVMKITGLEYAQYTVKVTAAYNEYFDHTTAEGCYDLYLDAVRIYDPTGNQNETANNAYVADGEGWPVYVELRNNVIEAQNYEVTENEDGTVTVTGDDLSGAIFIDSSDATTSIADYVSYGPNNELYLANGQAIAFNVAVDDTVADVQLGIKVGNGDSVTYTINGDTYTTNSATDLYYSILAYAKAGTVVIQNTSGGILSLTNIKVTHTSDPNAISTSNLLWMDEASVGFALMSLRAPAVEETEPETTEPEVVETEAETAESETEETEVETTESEIEETEVEPTEAETEETEAETTESEIEETEVEPTEAETEETEAETTESEIEETEVEPTEPETEETEAEPTESEPEETEEETSEPEANDSESLTNIIKNVISKIRDTISSLFGRLFK